ncbi:hypothetical protein [Halorubrum ezzemoulense]|nr:hypothetical protein [Halorubrum ezzemoulense]MDB2237068.1 hypothetical protein [Halorubrum ezzemoulense]
MSLDEAIELRDEMLRIDEEKNFHPSSGGELAARLSWARQRIRELDGEEQ